MSQRVAYFEASQWKTPVDDQLSRKIQLIIEQEVYDGAKIVVHLVHSHDLFSGMPVICTTSYYRGKAEIIYPWTAQSNVMYAVDKGSKSSTIECPLRIITLDEVEEL